MMKIIGIAMVRNEDDIIESFVRRNLRYLDHLSIISHTSTDQTDTILENLRAEGLPVEIGVTREQTFRQGELLSGLARKCFAEHGADIVIPLDADEFIKAPAPDALRQLFGKLPRAANAAWSSQSYVPLESDDPARIDPVARITHRRIAEEHTLHKSILTRCFADDPSLCLLEGSHSVFRRVGAELQASSHAMVRELALAHYPVRSPQQLAKKILINVWSRKVTPHELESSHAIAWHWKQLYQQFLTGGIPSSRQLTDLAFAYQKLSTALLPCDRSQLVFDPLTDGCELRYTPDDPLAYLQSIVQWVDAYIDLSLDAATRAADPRPAVDR